MQVQHERLPSRAKIQQARVKDRSKYRGEVEFSDGLTIERVLMTPDMADQFLATLYDKQRSKKDGHLGAIVRDISENRWKFNGETVVFDEYGRLVNGQHRCAACVAAGIAIDVVIIRGVPAEAYDSFDNVGKRSGSDAIKLKAKNTVAVSSALSMLYRWDRGIALNALFVASPTLIAEMLVQHPGMNDSGVIGKAAASITKSAAAGTFCHYIFSRVDRGLADQFMDTVTNGENIAKGNPIYAFRQRFINEERNLRAHDVVYYLNTTWNTWRQNKHVLILKSPAYGTKIPTPI